MKKIGIVLSIFLVSVGLLFIRLSNKRIISDEDIIGVYLDEVLQSEIPGKGEGKFIKAVCDNNGKASWDNDAWGLFVSDMTKKTKCNLYFSSDTIKPAWQVSNISSSNVLTTDIYTIRLEGSDNSKVSSSLSKEDISFVVGGNTYNPIAYELVNVDTKENKVVYDLKVHMLRGEGDLVLKIKSGTLIDDSNNESDEGNLNTGIKISKNSDTKILVWKDWYSHATENLSLFYSNLTVDAALSTSVSNIKNEKYDIVVYYWANWGGLTYLNQLYDSGINVISQFDDYTENLTIFDKSNSDVSVSNYTEKIYKVVDNKLTNYLGNNFIDNDSSRALFKFNSKATVLYKTNYDNTAYDIIGYLKEKDNMWFEIGMSSYVEYAPIVEFVMGRLNE